MGRILSVDLIKKLMRLLIGLLPQLDPSTRVEGKGIKFTFRVFLHHFSKVENRLIVLSLMKLCFSHPIQGRPHPSTIWVFFNQSPKVMNGILIISLKIAVSPSLIQGLISNQRLRNARSE